MSDALDLALQQLMLERLADDAKLTGDAQDLILAALEGAEELERTLAGGKPQTLAEAQPPRGPLEPPGAYLHSVAVTGFRGIGERAALEFTAGPGLTLVMGRNGSGKSSFAEGLELLLTGENSRWKDRVKPWREGWRNLHDGGGTALEATLQVEGQRGSLKTSRGWEPGADLDDGALRVTTADGSTTTLDALGWASAVVRYRPFLSYNELGSMFEKPKTMYEALAVMLGLEDVEDLAETLRQARLERDRAVKAMRESVRTWRDRLASVQDERARAILAALEPREPDVDAIDLALLGAVDGSDPAGDLATLRSLATLAAPDPQRIADTFDAWKEARRTIDEMAGSDVARAASLADLLDGTLAHRANHDDPDCPVCGTTGVLDDDWRRRAESEIGRLRAEAQAMTAVQQSLSNARRSVMDLVAPNPPAAMADAAGVGLDAQAVVQAWDCWRTARGQLTEPGAAETTLALLVAEITQLASTAQAELERREDAWRPIAVDLTAWTPEARRAIDATHKVRPLKAAEDWVKDAVGDLRTKRFAPIANQAKANWEQLRRASNVSIESLTLKKSGVNRSAIIDVRVDGSQASAWGVMSQGELHSLAVSVFLPRASLPESPFRFMVIDDPVQSMDPTKVDGLARVLANAAKTHQVVVFTHDERLATAVRRLGLPAWIKEVTVGVQVVSSR